MLQNAKTLMIYLHSRMPGRQWKGDYQLEFTFWPLGASHFIGGYHIWTICIDSCHIFQWTESMYPRRTYSIWMHITSPPNPNEHKGDNLDSPDGGRSLDMDWMGIQFPSHPPASSWPGVSRIVCDPVRVPPRAAVFWMFRPAERRHAGVPARGLPLNSHSFFFWEMLVPKCQEKKLKSSYPLLKQNWRFFFGFFSVFFGGGWSQQIILGGKGIHVTSCPNV